MSTSFSPDSPNILLGACVIHCSAPETLAQFYSKLLQWKIISPPYEGQTALASPAGTVLSFQQAEPGTEGPGMHLDLRVRNLEEAVLFALRCGAKLASTQDKEYSRTMLDPAGRLFYLHGEPG